MSRICPLFSSSSGNSTYIGTSCGGFLVDAGASCKSLSAAVTAAGGQLEDIKAVFITHEHSDHIKGLNVLLKKTKATLVASLQTLKALTEMNCIPPGTDVVCIDTCADIAGIQVVRFETSHDCYGSSGFVFTLPDHKTAAVCTDLGVVSQTVRSAVTGCDLVLLESNHDIGMLQRGPYPPQLKLRILSERGHLSNNACASELCGLLHSGTTRFILGHLSQHNNLPLLAKNAAEAALMDIGAQNCSDYILSVAKPHTNEVTIL